MKPWLALMVLVSVTPSLSNAAESGGGGYGIGMHTCGEFAKAYVAHPDVTEDLYFTWAQGFMTGLNFMATVVKLPAREIRGENMDSMKSYHSYIRTYCDSHPLAGYLEAVSSLWRSLPSIPPPKTN
jgi:hypothetical protein